MAAYNLVAFLAVLIFVVDEISSRHIQFHLNGYECFYEDIVMGTKSSVEYAPISGSKPHVDVTIEDPNQVVFYRKNQQEYDYFKFTTNVTGTHRVCFSNIYDLSMYNNIVYFDFVVGSEGAMVKLDSAETAPMTQVETSIVNIYDAMRIVELYQNHHRIREANGRLVGQKLNEKVMWWSLGQTGVFVVIACVQVYILKQFFAEKKENI